MSSSRPRASTCLLPIAIALLLGACDDGGSRKITLGDASMTPGEPASLSGITDLHNQARAMVSPSPSTAIPDLAWSDELAADAAIVADECEFEHSGNGHGENLFASAGYTPDALDVVGSWVSESVDYSYRSNSCESGEVCGHYTQVVWRTTTEVGCALRECTTGSPFGGDFSTWTLVVCNYDPPGNSGGKPY